MVNYGNSREDREDRSEDETLKNKYWDKMIKPVLDKYKKWVILGTGAAILGFNSVYIVPGGSEGVVKTFGKYTSISEEGIHGKIPFAQTVTIVNTDKVYEETFGYRQKSPGAKSEYIGVDDILANKVDESTLSDIIEAEGYKVGDNPIKQAAAILQEEYLMLTGDLNMADIEYSVQYKIVDPVAYLMNVKESRRMIRDYTQSCTKTIIGDASIDEALTTGRTMISPIIKDKINKDLEYNKCGLQIIVYKLQSGNPPKEVRESFRSVNNAIAERQTKINKARGEANEKIPKAQGTADQIISEAQGYAIKRINDAQGDVNAFRSVYNEYKKNPDITTSRIVLETYDEMMRGGTQNTLDLTNQNGGLLLKHLNINGDNGGDGK